MNLLRNSVDALASARTPDPLITIRTSIDLDIAELTVEDNGPGVPDRIYPQLFQRWATAGKADGVGIGLSFAADAIGLMGGKIEYLTPRGNPHACFRIKIPRRYAAAPLQPSQ